MLNKIENILFDLDGTLTNPKEGIINSILYALNKLGIKENRINELDSFIGPPLIESFAKRYNLADKDASDAVKFYREYFSVKGLYENELYPGIEKLLDFLMDKQYKLFVATSKPTIYTIRIIEHFKLDKYFTGIVGSNIDNTLTDKTEIISYVIDKYRIAPSSSVMIGDRSFDIIGAKNNLMHSIGVTYGYGSLDELESQSPDYIVRSISELFEHF